MMHDSWTYIHSHPPMSIVQEWGVVILRHNESIMPLADSIELTLQDMMVICWLRHDMTLNDVFKSAILDSPFWISLPHKSMMDAKMY